MDFFNYTVELPFSQKVINYRELNTQEQLVLAKANLMFPRDGTNSLGFFNFTQKVLKNCLEDKNSLDEINILDFLIFITKIRIESIGNNIELISESSDKKKIKTKIDLNVFLTNLYNASINAMNDCIIEENDVQVKIGWPSTLSVSLFQNLLNNSKNQQEAFSDTFQEFIENINYKGYDMPIIRFSIEQKIKIVEKLSVSILKKVQEKILEAIKELLNTDLWSVYTFKDYVFNFYSLSFVDFMRLFLSYDIKTIYQEICYLASCNISAEYTMKLSPSERGLHLVIVQDSKKEANQSYSDDVVSKPLSDVDKLALEFGQSIG